MQRYNRTNFTSAAFAERLIAAMRGALSDGYAHYVENRHGQRWLRVDVKPDEFGGYTFQFLAGSGQDVGSLILQACFVWSEETERAFSGLLAELYTRTEHPLLTARRLECDPIVEVKPLPAKSRWKSAIKETLGYLTALAIGGGAGHGLVYAMGW
ncbi:hypothetical protein Kallioja_00008 [Pseudomonas phage vB_PpuP-Kallioja]